jgi:hypothetical protein
MAFRCPAAVVQLLNGEHGLYSEPHISMEKPKQIALLHPNPITKVLWQYYSQYKNSLAGSCCRFAHCQRSANKGVVAGIQENII